MRGRTEGEKDLCPTVPRPSMRFITRETNASPNNLLIDLGEDGAGQRSVDEEKGRGGGRVAFTRFIPHGAAYVP